MTQDNQETPDDAPAPQDSGGGGGTGDAQAVPLGDHVEILPDSRDRSYDANVVCAYNARTVGLDEDVPLVATICERALIPREDAAPTYTLMSNPSLLPLVARGMVDWPTGTDSGRGGPRYAFVYKKTGGKAIAPVTQNRASIPPGAAPSVALGLKPEWVAEHVVTPLSRVLQDFRDKDFVHGRINPHNIFRHVDPSAARVVLGECLSTPGAFVQPALYEPPQRAMADPIGRGLGTRKDDMYALGVSLACMLRHVDPMVTMGPEDVIRKKGEIGTYNALMGDDRFSGPVLELLRGLMADEDVERWDVGDMLAWIDGRRLSPKQGKRVRVASRPITFAGQHYLRPDFLAMDLRKSPEALDQLIDSGEMETWITRALEDESLHLRLKKNVAGARVAGRKAGYAERLTCLTSIALDPRAPIRYGSATVNPEGIGTALANAMAKGADADAFAQILLLGIVIVWIASQEGLLTGLSSLSEKFEECRGHVRSSKMGFGIERCVYVLSPSCFCLSPTFEDHYVHTAEDMLRTLEALCKEGKAPQTLLDRHSVAFLAVRDKKAIESFLYDLSSADLGRMMMGTLGCLAALQQRTDAGPLPGLARTFADRMEDVYARFHDRNLRTQIGKKVDDFAKAGQLAKMLSLLDNEKLAHQDHVNFRRAQRDYLRVSREYQAIATQMGTKEPFGHRTGQQVGAVISALVAGTIVLVIAFVYMTGRSVFPVGMF